jgi:ribulose-5-phosphate 4-epimerase/fuculose-1-phosphate aldolase
MGIAVHQPELESQLSAGFRRLADKGYFNSPSSSLSVRIPGTGDMLLASGHENRQHVVGSIAPEGSLTPEESLPALHASIYDQRPDAGAIAISSSNGVRLLARSGAVLPVLFDEQARHIGPPGLARLNGTRLTHREIGSAFQRGRNAALMGDELICLGMTCERAVFNTELFEKCAQACVIVEATGIRAGTIPGWVCLIANRRLKRDQRHAAACFLNGRLPDNISVY